MSLVERFRSRAPEPLPVPEPDKLELHVLAAMARIDAAMGMYRVNRMLSQTTMADALLDVRHRLAQGLETHR